MKVIYTHYTVVSCLEKNVADKLLLTTAQALDNNFPEIALFNFKLLKIVNDRKQKDARLCTFAHLAKALNHFKINRLVMKLCS